MADSNDAAPQAPLPQDKGRWRVAPAPDGRGTPDEHKARPPHRWRGFWIFLAALLAINLVSVLMTRSSGQPRVKVPFSPYFLHQVDAGRVKSISSKGDTINGTFAHKVRYPPSKKSTPTTLFSTEVPTFWSSAALTRLLQAKGVQVNAQNPSPGTSLITEVLLGFGRRYSSSACSGSSPDGPRPAPAAWVGWACSDARRRAGRTRRRSR